MSLFGCTQGTPAGPGGLSPVPDRTTVVELDDGGVGLARQDGGDLPPAVAVTSALTPFDLAPSLLFSPVVQAERAPPPLSGGTLALAADGTAVLSDPDRDQVYLVDPAKQTSLALALTPGDEPGRIAVNDKRAYVALRAGGALVTLDLATQKVSARTPVCAAPRGVFFDASVSRVLVACAGGELVSVAADGASVLSKAQVASDLRDVGRDARGLWVTQFRSAALLRLDASFNLQSRALPAQVTRISQTLMPATDAMPALELSPTLAFRTISAPGGEPWMLHQRAQTSSVTPGFGGYGSFNDGFCEGGIVHTTITSFDQDAPAAQAALPQAVVPIDLSLSPDGRFAAVVAPGNLVRQDLSPQTADFFGGPSTPGNPAQQLFFFKTSALKRSSVGAPLGSDAADCILDAGRWEHRFPGETVAVQFVDAHSFLVQVRNPAELHVFRLDDAENPRLQAIVALSSDAVRDTGHEIFHQNAGSGIACASCHGEATDDAHVWTFEGIGGRRTQALRGGVVESAPFHWSGDLPDMSALIDDVYQKRMGGAMLADDARAALGHWLDRVPLIPTEAWDPEAAARGRALFASTAVGCASCHAGEDLRAAGSYDVGTGGSFQVPSLHGVSLRLPLMHNGCADTLAKRFDPTCGGGDNHGTTSQLSEAQIGDLVAYLGSL